MCRVWSGSHPFRLPHLSSRTPASCPLSLLPGVRVHWMVGHGFSAQLLSLLHHGVSVPEKPHLLSEKWQIWVLCKVCNVCFNLILDAVCSSACTRTPNEPHFPEARLRCHAKSLTRCISATACVGMTRLGGGHLVLTYVCRAGLYLLS